MFVLLRPSRCVGRVRPSATTAEASSYIVFHEKAFLSMANVVAHLLMPTILPPCFHSHSVWTSLRLRPVQVEVRPAKVLLSYKRPIAA